MLDLVREAEKRTDMQRVNVNKATPGMVLEQNVLDQKGRLLFQSGQTITERHIRIFKIWGVTEIWVQNGESGSSSSPPSEEGKISDSAYEKAQQSLKNIFRRNSLQDPFLQEMYRVSLERAARKIELEELDPSFATSPVKNTATAPSTPASNQITIARLVDKNLKLATLPSIYYKTMAAVYDPEMSISDIADIVSTDPTMSAKILQLVNSSFYGLLKRVDTLTRALALIGTNHMMTIIAGVSVTSVFQRLSSTVLNMNRFWEHSIACGIVARLLASHVPGIVNSERYFVAGLLHDIGRLIMVQSLPRQMQSIFALAEQEDLSLPEAEKRVLGFDHCQVGQHLAQKWNLPGNLEKMVHYHHQPQLEEGDMDANILYLANFFTNAMGAGSGGETVLPPFQEDVWQRLSLSPGIVESTMVQMERQLQDTFELIYGYE